MTTAARVLEIAAGQIGTAEDPPGSNNVLYTRWAGMVGQPWCDIFISWCFSAAGLAALEGFHAYTPDHYQSFLGRGRGRPGIAGIAAGDIVFYDFPGEPDRISHVGLVERVLPDGSFVAIEGNTDAAGGRTGGRVMRHTRRNYVIGYGRPAYTGDQEMPLTRNDLFAIGVTVKACLADLEVIERLERIERKTTRSRKLARAIATKVGLTPRQIADAQRAKDPDADLGEATPVDELTDERLTKIADKVAASLLETPVPPRPPVDLAGDQEAAVADAIDANARRVIATSARRPSSPKTGRR